MLNEAFTTPWCYGLVNFEMKLTHFSAIFQHNHLQTRVHQIGILFNGTLTPRALLPKLRHFVRLIHLLQFFDISGTLCQNCGIVCI